MVLIAGGIDISFPAVTAIAQYVMASWVIQHGGSFRWRSPGDGVGLLLGLVNGFRVLAESAGDHHHHRHP